MNLVEQRSGNNITELFLFFPYPFSPSQPVALFSLQKFLFLATVVFCFYLTNIV